MIKIQKYSFLILLITLFSTLSLIYSEDINITIAALLSLVSSIFIFILHIKNKNEQKDFKIVNIIVLNIFIFFQILFVLISLYASPDEKVYSIQSSIFLLSFSLVLSSVFFYTKKNIFKIKNIFSFIYFLISSLIIVSFSLVYTFANPSGIEVNKASFIGIISFLILIISTIYLKRIEEIAKKWYIVRKINIYSLRNSYTLNESYLSNEKVITITFTFTKRINQ